METVYTTIKVKLKVSEPQAKISEPETAIKLLRTIYSDLDDDQEHFTFLALNKRNSVTGYKVCFSGGQSEALVDAKVLFRNALLLGASALILCHNHPSGRTEPSREDIDLTKKLREGASILGLVILDHLILTKESYLSFRETGLI